MINKQGHGTIQVQTQTQQLTPQQVLLVRLTELPLNDLRERIDKELEDNPWLQGDLSEQSGTEGSDYETKAEDSAYDGTSDGDERVEPAPTSVLFDDEDDGSQRDSNDKAEENRR